MYKRKQTIVIVNAYSTGSYYAPNFYGRGYNCIHISTPLKTTGYLTATLNTSYFSENIILTPHNADETINYLKQYDVKAIIAGSEMGVVIADQLAQHFDVIHNDLTKIPARRNKFEMNEALRKSNVPHAQQFCSDNLSELLADYKKFKFKKIVIKPTLSAVSEGAAICYNADDIANHFNKYVNKVNITGETNTHFVIQEYLSGPEFMVNTVSAYGKHFVTDAWIGVGGIPDVISTDKYADLLKRDSNQFQILEAYARRVLDAVGLQFGPAHIEIKITPDGPKLVEIGARLTGGFDFSAIEECCGYSQVSLSVESYLAPENFETRMNAYKKFPQQSLRFIYLASPIAGVIQKPIDLKPFFANPYLHSMTFLHKEGDYLPKTNEVVGRPGYAFILGKNEDEIEEGYQKFLATEQEFYRQIISTK